ncbi:hypothetical protein B1T44_30125, partial [Mycobacterium persicum]
MVAQVGPAGPAATGAQGAWTTVTLAGMAGPAGPVALVEPRDGSAMVAPVVAGAQAASQGLPSRAITAQLAVMAEPAVRA